MSLSRRLLVRKPIVQKVASPTPRRLSRTTLAAVALAAVCIPSSVSAAASPAVPAAPPAVVTGAVTTVFPIINYGAVTNGTTDDRDALGKAIDVARRAGGGIVQIPDRKVLVRGGWLELPDNVTIAGVGASSEILFTANSASDWRLLFRVVGENVSIKNVKLTRSSEFSGVMIDLRASRAFSMEEVTVDGRKDSYRSEFHGILVYGNAPSAITDATLRNSTFRRLDFGLLQPSERTIAVNGFTVDGCTFELNAATDLEFNAPSSVMSGVIVANSRFRNNKSTSHSAGWGVGFANVRGGTVKRNQFRGYGMNPIHIEDRSREIVVADNTFTRTSTINTGYASDVLVISGSRDVNITGNTFNGTTKPAGAAAVYVGSGGSSLEPNNVIVTNNTSTLGSGVSFLVQHGAQNVVSFGNSNS